MAIYIQLLTLTPEGRSKSLEDPGSVLRAQQGIAVPDVQELGLYGVLGDYDFVNIVQAKDNESVARYSLELGVRIGAHITTMPAIPVARLRAVSREGLEGTESEVSLPMPDVTSDVP